MKDTWKEMEHSPCVAFTCLTPPPTAVQLDLQKGSSEDDEDEDGDDDEEEERGEAPNVEWDPAVAQFDAALFRAAVHEYDFVFVDFHAPW